MFLTRTAGLLACTALVAPVPAQGKPFKHALPSNTLAFLSMPDLNTTLGEFRGTALAKMWREDEVQDFFKDALQMAREKWKEGKGMLEAMHDQGKFPVAPADLLKLRVNSVSAALTTVGISVGQFGPEPKVGILWHVDFGDSAPTWRKLIALGIEALVAQTGGAVERSTTKLDNDVELITLTPPTTEMSVNIAFVNGGVVLGSLTDEVKACVNALTGDKTILAKDPDYMATARHLDVAGAEMEMYIHLAGLVDVVIDFLKIAEQEAPEWPEELQIAGIERALTAFGMRTIRSVGLTTKYEGDKSVTRSFALAPKENRKGVFAGKSSTLDLGFLKWVPADVVSLTAYSMDVGSIYDGLVAAVKAYSPEMADGLLGRLADREKQFGMTLKDDLFGVFGDQLVWWSMGVQSFLSAPEGALLLKVKDQDRLLKTLKNLAAMTDGMVEFPESERKGVKTWRLEVDVPDEKIAMALSMFQPCFSFKNGYMVMALSTGDVRRAFKRMDRDDDATNDIRSNKEFVAYMDSIAQQNVSSMDWRDWRVSFESTYSAITNVVSLAVSTDDVPFDLTLLPEAETLSQHLFSSMVSSADNGEGYLSTSTSPVGPELFVGAAALGAGAAGFMFARRAGIRPPVVESAPAAEPVEQGGRRK